MKDNIIADKSKAFAIRIVKMYKYLTSVKGEYVLSKQVLRSGTSIGANITEATDAQSRADFIAKLGISLKECSETLYWLEILYKSGYLNKRQYASIYSDAKELVKILTSIIKTSKENTDKNN